MKRLRTGIGAAVVVPDVVDFSGDFCFVLVFLSVCGVIFLFFGCFELRVCCLTVFLVGEVEGFDCDACVA